MLSSRAPLFRLSTECSVSMLGRVGGARRDETWMKRVRMRMFLLLLVGGARGRRRSGAPRVCDVAFVRGVPISTSQRIRSTRGVLNGYPIDTLRNSNTATPAHHHVPHTRPHRPWNHRPCRTRNGDSRAQTRCAFPFPFIRHSAHAPSAAQITILSKIPPNNSKLTCKC